MQICECCDRASATVEPATVVGKPTALCRNCVNRLVEIATQSLALIGVKRRTLLDAAAASYAERDEPDDDTFLLPGGVAINPAHVQNFSSRLPQNEHATSDRRVIKIDVADASPDRRDKYQMQYEFTCSYGEAADFAAKLSTTMARARQVAKTPAQPEPAQPEPAQPEPAHTGLTLWWWLTNAAGSQELQLPGTYLEITTPAYPAQGMPALKLRVTPQFVTVLRNADGARLGSLTFKDVYRDKLSHGLNRLPGEPADNA